VLHFLALRQGEKREVELGSWNDGWRSKSIRFSFRAPVEVNTFRGYFLFIALPP